MTSRPDLRRCLGRRPGRGLRLTLVALPIVLLAALAGQEIAGISSGPGTVAELVLTSSSGSSLVEQLSSVTVSASRPPTAGPGIGRTSYHVSATTGIAPASVDGALVAELDRTSWSSATVTLDNLRASPRYRFGRPEVLAYLLQHGTGTAAVGPSGDTGAPAQRSGLEDSVQITLASAQLLPSLATAGSSTTSVPPTTLPKPAVQTCVSNPQKPTSPHSSFPPASYEVPTLGTIRQSSPALATVVLGGQQETIAVFGDEAGMLYVVDAATCQILPGWPQALAVPSGQLLGGLARDNRHAVIESTPAVGFPRGRAGPPLIVVGAGSTWDNTGVGEVEAFNLSGQEQWDFPVQGSAKNANGVFSSPSFGPVVPGTGLDVVFGAWDYYLYVLDARGNVVARYYNGETIWSSPALFEVPGQDLDDVFVGLDKSRTALPGACVGGQFAELRYGAVPVGTAAAAGSTGLGSTYSATKLRAATAPARQGLYLVRESACQGAPPLGDRGQAIWSSPALGELGGRLVAAVGTSFYDSPYGSGTDRLYVYPVSSGAPFRWSPIWEATTPGPVVGSPAIGLLAVSATSAPGAGAAAAPAPAPGVVDTSFDCPSQPQTRASCLKSGRSEVQAWAPPSNPASGQLTLLWSRSLPGGDSLDSPVLVPLQAERANDVLVGSGGGLFPLSGGSGAFLDGTGTDPPQLAIHSACVLFNSPAVADVVGNGPYRGWNAYELCSYGGDAKGGGLFAYHLPESLAAGTAPGWPMFRGDPTHSGVSWQTLGAAPPSGDPVG